MTTQEIIQEVIKLATQVGIFGIAAYWIQKQIDKSSQQRLEEFKSTLSLLSSKGTKLHEKRFHVIEELYSKLVDLESSMIKLTHPVKFSNDYEKQEIDLLNTANAKFQDFTVYFEKTKIYFNPITCNQIEIFREEIREAFMNYHEHTLFKKDEVDKETFISARKKKMVAFQSMTNDIPSLKNNLELDFRKIMIVD